MTPSRARHATRRGMAAPLALALGGHAALAALLVGMPYRALPPAAEAPAVEFAVEVTPAPLAHGVVETAEAASALDPAPGEPGPAPPPVTAQIALPPPSARPPEHPPERPRNAVRLNAPPAGVLPAAVSSARSVPAIATATATAATLAPTDPHAIDAWQAALAAWINRNRIYPETARQQHEHGTVQIRFTLDSDGRVTTAMIQRESGSGILDAAALALLRGAQLPAPPVGLDPARRTVSVAIRYRLE